MCVCVCVGWVGGGGQGAIAPSHPHPLLHLILDGLNTSSPKLHGTWIYGHLKQEPDQALTLKSRLFDSKSGVY